MTEFTPEERDRARELFDAMTMGQPREEWGHRNILTIAGTRPDEHGVVEVAVLDESGSPIWEPITCLY